MNREIVNICNIQQSNDVFILLEGRMECQFFLCFVIQSFLSRCDNFHLEINFCIWEESKFNEGYVFIILMHSVC